LPRFHLITDFETLDRDALTRLLAVVGEGLAGTPRVDAVQVRAKQASDREVFAWTRELLAELAPRGTSVIVDDRLDVALAAGAHGVHLGRNDLSVADARALAPAGFLVGATCRGPEPAIAARAEGADYVGVGPMHAT
jgi:thiamine-phosphate pyrophosphorylase